MRRFALWRLWLALFVCASVSAAEPSKVRELTASSGNELRAIEAPGPGVWKLFHSDTTADLPAKLYGGGALAVLDAPPGVYVVMWRPLAGPWQQFEIQVGKKPVVPPKPVPPKPTPTPIVSEGLHCLIVEETADRARLAPGQREIILSNAPDGVRGWLSIHKAAVRVLDQNADMAADDPVWQEAMKRPRNALPWWIVSNGKAGFEGPLPATAAEALAKLKEVFGQ